jgi:hypothetical protein
MVIRFGGKTAKDFAAAVDHGAEAQKLWEQGLQLIGTIADLERALLDYKDWLDANGDDERYVERRRFWRDECERRYILMDHLAALSGKFERAAKQCSAAELSESHGYASQGGAGMMELMSDAAPAWVIEPAYYPGEGMLAEGGF